MRFIQSLFVIASFAGAVSASAAGVCDLSAQAAYVAQNLTGGRTQYGTTFVEPVGDPSSISDGRLNQPITIQDDAGNSHVLSGRIDVETIDMIAGPQGSFACVSVLDRDRSYSIAFQIADKQDLLNTPIPAATSGRGVGLRVLSQGPEHVYPTEDSEYIDQGTEFTFGLTSASGKVLGSFMLVRNSN